MAAAQRPKRTGPSRGGRAAVSELATRPPRSTPERALAGELVDPGGLTVRAAEVAARQRSPETRRIYAAVYRAFGAFLGPDAAPADLTPEAVRAYRDALERAGRSPATVAKHLSALRGLAEALGVETQQLRTVRSERVGPRRAACAHSRRVGAAAAHTRPPDPPRQARPRAAAPARLRRPATRRSRPHASHRHRRAPPRQRPAAPASHQGLHRLVGDRALRQARPHPRRPARRRRPGGDRRLGQEPPHRRQRPPAALAAAQRPANCRSDGSVTPDTWLSSAAGAPRSGSRALASGRMRARGAGRRPFAGSQGRADRPCFWRERGVAEAARWSPASASIAAQIRGSDRQIGHPNSVSHSSVLSVSSSPTR